MTYGSSTYGSSSYGGSIGITLLPSFSIQTYDNINISENLDTWTNKLHVTVDDDITLVEFAYVTGGALPTLVIGVSDDVNISDWSKMKLISLVNKSDSVDVEDFLVKMKMISFVNKYDEINIPTEDILIESFRYSPGDEPLGRDRAEDY